MTMNDGSAGRKGHLPHLSAHYDMTSFFGRLQYHWALCSPLGLRWGARDVSDAMHTIGRYRDAVNPPTTEELKHAQTVLAASAPQGTLLPWPCRTSGWAVATVPVMAFIQWNAVARPTSLPHIVIGQWLNQTQNAAITWFNRPPVSNGSTSTVSALVAYVAACAAAIPIAVGAGIGARRSRLLRRLGKFAPYPAVACANVVNTCMMRSDDLRTGVPLFDAAIGDALDVGRSVVAGQWSVGWTAITRTLIPLANFVGAPLVMAAIERLRGAGKPRSIPLQLGVTFCVLVGAIPIASSISPPICSIAVEDVEPAIAAAVAQQRPGTRVLHFERGF